MNSLIFVNPLKHGPKTVKSLTPLAKPLKYKVFAVAFFLEFL